MLKQRVFVGQIVMAFVTAAGLGLDFADVRINDQPVAWQLVALAAFVVFVGLVWWQQWDLLRRLHPERLVRVMAFGEPSPHAPRDWRSVKFDPDNERITHTDASVRLVARNRDIHRRVLTDVYLEVVTRRWWFFRRVVAEVDPNIIDNHAGLVNEEQPRRVNWELEPEGDEIVHVIDFERWWKRAEGPKHPSWTDRRLVLEYGGPDRRVRIPIAPPPETPLPRVRHIVEAEAASQPDDAMAAVARQETTRQLEALVDALPDAFERHGRRQLAEEAIAEARPIRNRLADGAPIASDEHRRWVARTAASLKVRDESLEKQFRTRDSPTVPIRDDSLGASRQLELNEIMAQLEWLEALRDANQPSTPSTSEAQ